MRKKQKTNKKSEMVVPRLLAQVTSTSEHLRDLQFKKKAAMVFFLILQRIVIVLLAIFTCLVNEQPYFTHFQSIIAACAQYLTEQGPTSASPGLIIQVCILLLFLFLAFNICFTNRKISIELFLHTLTLTYTLSPSLLTLSALHLASLTASSDLLSVILSVLNILFNFIFSIYFYLIQANYSLRNNNSICTYPSTIYFAHEIGIRIFFVLIPFFVLFNVIFLVLLFLLTSAALYEEVRHFVFINDYLAKVHRLVLCIQLSCLFAAVLFLLTAKHRIFAQSFWCLIPALILFFWVTVERYIGYKNQQLFFIEESEIKSPEVAMRYTYFLAQIFCSHDQNRNIQKLIEKSFKQNHQLFCQNEACFCLVQREDSLFKNLVAEKIDRISARFENNFQLTLAVFYCKLEQGYIPYYIIHRLFKLSRFKKEGIAGLSNLPKQYLIEKCRKALQKFIDKKTQNLAIVAVDKIKVSEDLSKEIIGSWEKILETKTQFWNCLIKQFVDNETFDRLLVDQLKLMRTLEHFSLIVMGEFSASYILIAFLVAYYKFILLKQKLPLELENRIASLKTKPIKTKLLNKSAHKDNWIDGELYESACCCFQSPIDTQNMGLILHASKNVEKVFGFKPSEVEGFSINKIMIPSMRYEHDILLQNWHRFDESNSWRRVGKMNSIFGLNKYGVCFSMSIYLKIIQRESTVNILATCFLENQKDYLLINNKKIIDGAGSNFISALGYHIIGLPLSIVCKDYQQISNPILGNTKQSMTFYSVKNMKEKMQNFKSLHNELAKRSTIIDAEHCVGEEIRNEGVKMEIVFTTSLFKMGSTNFTVLKALKMSPLEGEDKEYPSESCVQPKQQNNFEMDFYNTLNKKDEQKSALNCSSSNMSASSENNFVIENIISRYENIFHCKRPLRQKRIILATTLIIVACLFSFANLIVKLEVSYKGILEINELFFSDYTSNDNMQLLELSFNQAINLKLYRNDPAYQQLRKSFEYEHEYNENLTNQELGIMTNSKTSLTNHDYFPYIMENFAWFSNEYTKSTVTGLQFVRSFLFLGKKLIFQTKYGPSAEIDRVLNLMNLNFPTLKEINQKNLNLYAGLLLQTQNSIQRSAVLKFVLSVGVSGFLMAFLCCHYSFRQKQEQRILNQFGSISKENCWSIYTYYQNLSVNLNTYLRKTMIEKQNILEADLQAQIKGFARQLENCKLKGEKKMRSTLSLIKKPYRRWALALALGFLIMSLENLLMLLMEKALLNNCNIIVNNINQLMKSQNFILEVYLDLKRLHNIDSNDQGNGEAWQDIMKQGENYFTKSSEQSIKLFQEFDSSFANSMSKLLTFSLCKLVKELPLKHLTQECNSSLLDSGVIFNINFFQRVITDTIYLNKESLSIDFMSPEFKTIDFAMFYMFKMFQKIEKQISLFVQMVTMKYFSRENIVVGVEFMLICCVVVFAAIFYDRQRQKSIDRFGVLVLVPISVINETKRMINEFERIVGSENQS